MAITHKSKVWHLKKKILGPVHLLTQRDKWDYLWGSIIGKKHSCFDIGRFLEAPGCEIGTGSVFCHSLSFSNNVILFVSMMTWHFWFILWQIIPFWTSNLTRAMKEWCCLCISDFAKYDILSIFMLLKPRRFAARPHNHGIFLFL